MSFFKQEEPKNVHNPSFKDLTSCLFALLNLAVNYAIHLKKKCTSYYFKSHPIKIQTLPLFYSVQCYFSFFLVPLHFTEIITFTLRHVMTN